MTTNNNIHKEQTPSSIMRETQQAVAFMKDIERCGYASVASEDIGTILHTFPIVGGGADYILINADDKKLRVTAQDGNWACHAQEEHWGVYDPQGRAFSETFPTLEAAREWIEEQERKGILRQACGGIWCRREPNCPECKAEMINMAPCELLTDRCEEMEAPCVHCWRVKHEQASE